MATKKNGNTKKAAQPKAPGMATAAYLAATAKADQENARLREERTKSKDGQTASERAMATQKKSAAKASAKPKASTKKAKSNGRLSAIDAALKVLAEAKKPMNCAELIEAMVAKKLWSSPNGKTPAATLYSAILRDIQTGGKDARFRKVERGRFTLAKKGA